ncbi:hypothetical protein [Prosthecobacter sp.]|jgi:hypothetical protein|uniref:hypothetical protein n=1 Tax=Prosthecobacter sp. TaxID=1965333 RepID=UPI003784C2D4
MAMLIATPALSQMASTEALRLSHHHATEAVRAAQWVSYYSDVAARNPQHQSAVSLAWQWKHYETQQQQWSNYYQQFAPYEVKAISEPPKQTLYSMAETSRLTPIIIRGGCAYGLSTLPAAVHRIIDAGNVLQDKPYMLGGGHRRLEDVGYDCSSSTSYMLIKAGLLQKVLNSTLLASYGEAGQGRYITLWVKPGHHVFITICGLRLDTSGGRVAEGPRWRTSSRNVTGFMPRHPRGL